MEFNCFFFLRRRFTPIHTDIIFTAEHAGFAETHLGSEVLSHGLTQFLNEFLRHRLTLINTDSLCADFFT